MTKSRLITVFLLSSIILFIFGLALAEEEVTIFFGNIDSSPVEANINELVEIDVFIQTAEDVYIADMLISLGVDNRYIDSLLSHTRGEIYVPFGDWDIATMLPPQGSPPNPEGWSSQSFLGFANMAPPYDSPWLHLDEPALVLKMAVWTANDQSLIGETVNCLGPGINFPQGPSNAGDTLGINGYEVSQQYSPIHFSGGEGK